MMKSKIHRVTVTEANLNYIGSITIDCDLTDAAGILEGQRVCIVNNNNGERFDTYTIAGPRGSGVICLNGAAARKAQPGDVIIIMAYALMTEEEAKVHPDRNIITRAVGIMSFVDIDYEITDFSEDDKILMCTDGLNGSVDDDVICDIVKSDVENKAEVLIKTAIDSGSRDNITVVLLDSVVGGE